MKPYTKVEIEESELMNHLIIPFITILTATRVLDINKPLQAKRIVT